MKIYKIFYEFSEGLTSYSAIPFVDAYDHKNKANSASGIMFQQLQAMDNNQSLENSTAINPSSSIILVDARNMASVLHPVSFIWSLYILFAIEN
ncbi:hypothetical protein DOY81_012624 [Sarcophaga bullata]|nr:hypothetical protein DOY81_012624 [Sarcophaga bullata]